MQVDEVESVDVAGIWGSQLDERPPRRAGGGGLGPRGWTLAVADVLAPCTTSTHVPWAYHDYRPYGSQRTVHEVNGDDGLVRFAGLGADAAGRLLAALTEDQLATRQRDSPTLGAVLRAAVVHPGVVEVHGYAVGPAREDERITAEGVFLYALPGLSVPGWPHDGPCDCTALWEAARDGYGLRDALGMPQELQRRTNRWRPGEHCWLLAWD
ncbi:hypothetical protein [Cellulomonas sp. P22]|uniref:hypothetical protein n=1 Tax=Cellulomonas sp. P22 TaxID=3373189 RepID=UPI0037C04C6F